MITLKFATYPSMGRMVPSTARILLYKVGNEGHPLPTPLTVVNFPAGVALPVQL
jgi:hypothetical protein